MTRQRSVKRIFSFSSGTLNRLGIWGAVIGSARDRPARLFDLRARGGGDRHALYAELAPHVAHAEQLDGVVRPADEPRPEQRVGRHLDALGELVEVPDVHHLRRLLEGVREAALRDAPDERHLAALEPGPCLAPGAGRLALPPAAGRLADPRAGPAPFADARAVRATRRLERRQAQVRQLALRRLAASPRSRFGPGLRLRHRAPLLPGFRGRHLAEVTHLIEHAPQRRVVPLHHGVLVVLEPERLERPALERGPADPRADLPDAELALAHGRQRLIPARLPFAVLPRGRLPSHAPSPAATCTESPRPRRHAPWRRAAPW